MSRSIPSYPILVAILICLPLGGCGEADSLVRAPVGGTIFTNGRPLKSGLVRFVPTGDTQGPVTVAAVNGGCFSLAAAEGPVVGTHRLEITATNFSGFDLGDQEAADRAMQAGGNRLPRSPVPARYHQNSPLVADIPPEGNISLDFAIGAGDSRM